MRWKTTELSGWGRALKSTTQVARPERSAALLDLCSKTPAPAIGALRSYGDAALNDGGKALCMTRLDRLIRFETTSGILEAEAGITIAEILRVFGPKGWMPAVMPGTGFATLGGCIANDVHGKNHHGAGSFGQHVTSLTLRTADGKLRTITPTRDKALFQATIGGLGQTGIIQTAKIRLTPCGSRMVRVNESRIDGLEEFLGVMEQSHATFSVGWIDTTASGPDLGRGIFEEAELAENALDVPPRTGKSIPFNAPSFALSGPVVRAFNALYFRRIPVEGRNRTRALEDFFFPLDKLHNWNRLYGKRGFHQFQCVIPQANAAKTLEQLLTLISSSGIFSPLAVLKRMGDGRAGYLSFPMEGYSLAVDLPQGARVAPLLDQLLDTTEAGNGRIYFAKDSSARPEAIPDMYPDLGQFQKVVANIDPHGLFKTDLVRRLKLRGDR